jgi:hypothetical protein
MSADPQVFGRYRNLARIGSGGMATVYRAHDPTLGRDVALKVLLFDEPRLAERLVFEARAQARIEHENVCPIYDAGHHAERPYIAMRHIEGATLTALRDSLTLEQKLAILRDVAEGVHAAHRVGLVHRDLKPSNIMVERTDAGWHPFVLDFGLAREVDSPGLTRSGTVQGTPWYMSPEQARADGEGVDRRSDVYSLGATLYELLCGEPPFKAHSSAAVLMKVIAEEPAPVRSRNPHVPVDVQSIVMKCLEKDPERRYPSARALAEDLGRYLDGEATQARPTGVWRVAARKVSRNRGVVAGIVVALLAGSASLVYAVRTRNHARTQARLAEEFAQAVEDVEWRLRVAHMAPLHDITGEKAAVRARLAGIRDRMNETGSAARGPGESALGRGALVLGEPDLARVHLEAAWHAGYRTAETAYALGLALGALYQRELALAGVISDRTRREARQRDLQAAYRDPAIAYLRQVTGVGVAVPEYVEGVLALHEKRYDDALRHAERAQQRVPWLFEARLLQGDVHVTLARTRHETGDAAGSRSALQAAHDAYAAASTLARSSPAALEGLCQIGVQRMEVRVYERGADVVPLFAAASGACEQVIAADPERAEAHAKLANIHRFWANHQISEGKEPFASLDRAADHARKAIALDPQNRRAHGNLGIIHRLRAAYEKDHGLPWEASLDAALVSLGKAVELSGDEGSLNDLGNAYLTRALARKETGGGDVPADLGQAIEHYDRALALVPDYGYAHANRGYALMHLAAWQGEHGSDPRSSLRAAYTSLLRTVELLPKLEGAHTRLAELQALDARQRLGRGEAAAEPIAHAKERLAEAAKINPRPGPDVRLIAGTVALLEARELMRQRRPARAALGEAVRLLQSAVEGDPSLREARERLREAEELRGRAG